MDGSLSPKPAFTTKPPEQLATTSGPKKPGVSTSDPNRLDDDADEEHPLCFKPADLTNLYGPLSDETLTELSETVEALKLARDKEKQELENGSLAAKVAETPVDDDKKPAAVETPPPETRHNEGNERMGRSPPGETAVAASAATADDPLVMESETEDGVAAQAADPLFSPQPLGEHLVKLRKQFLTKVTFPTFLPSLEQATASLPKPIKDEVSRAAQALFDATAKVTASQLVIERYAAHPDLIPSGARIKFGITSQYKNISKDEPTMIKIREELSGCVTDFHVNARRLVLAKVKFEMDFFTKQKVVEFLTRLHTLAGLEQTTWLIKNESVLTDPYAITNDNRKVVGQIIYRLLDDPTILTASVFTYLGMERMQCKAILQAGWYRPPKLRVAYELASTRGLLTSKDLSCINTICASMKKYVEPMTAGIQQLFDEAVQEKILDAHLRAQTAQKNVQNAAKATQAALDTTTPTSETDMAAYIKRAISAGVEEAVKLLKPSPQKNSQGHAKSPAVEPKGNSTKRQKGKGKNKEQKTPETASNKRQHTNTREDDNNAPKNKEKSNTKRKNSNRGKRGGKKSKSHQGDADDE
jgi:hypothetical protein